MMRVLKTFIAICFFIALVIAYLIFGSATSFPEKKKYLLITSSADAKRQVLQQLKEKELINQVFLFELVANNWQVWEKLRPGKFVVNNGESIFSLARKLRNNRQEEVKLVINKLRTPNDFKQLLAKNFALDTSSIQAFIVNNDSLSTYDVNKETLFSVAVPNTYQFYYSASMTQIFQKLHKAYKQFWTEERLQKATKQGFSPNEIITIASIVEEETNKQAEKSTIASVYINRLRKGMPLGADPTIKYALNDFTLKRILYVHLQVKSPYNTYKNKGLPPGPICTPSPATIDAVLNAPSTNYYYFVADASLNGYHHFSNTFQEHVQYAKLYQQALDTYFQQNGK
ncbi:MAG: endolytic transglycosylase MltG [Chitinophagaceae bacterium]